jgi:DNA-binding response OmpR family regulator
MPDPVNCILVVDDEPDLLSEVADHLRRHGQIVLTAASYGDVAREYDRNGQSISLVLTDVRMPDGHGIDLVR